MVVKVAIWLGIVLVLMVVASACAFAWEFARRFGDRGLSLHEWDEPPRGLPPERDPDWYLDQPGTMSLYAKAPKPREARRAHSE